MKGKPSNTNEDEEEPADLPRAKGGAGGDATNTKGAIDFYGMINDQSMNRVREKVPASGSVVLNKAQLTRMKYKAEHADREKDGQFKDILDKMRS